MRRLRVAIVMLGHLAGEVWRWSLRLYPRVRGRREAGAPASSIRRQYVFGAIGRKAFDAAIRQRRRLRRGKGVS